MMSLFDDRYSFATFLRGNINVIALYYHVLKAGLWCIKAGAIHKLSGLLRMASRYLFALSRLSWGVTYLNITLVYSTLLYSFPI